MASGIQSSDLGWCQLRLAIHRDVGFRAANGALIRAVAHRCLELPSCPVVTTTDRAGTAAWLDWLREVWAVDIVREAIGHASPGLRERIESMCVAEAPGMRATRRVVLSVVRYLARMVGRPTPNGLFAGVAFAGFAPRAHVWWGNDHRSTSRADAGWLAEIIDQLEDCLEVLPHLPVVVNTTLMVRGDRLIVPYQPYSEKRGAVEVSLRHTAPVRIALDVARAPIRFEDLCVKVQNEFPNVSSVRVTAVLMELVRQRVLVTSLHAPSTETDALSHLVRELESADGLADERTAKLKEIHGLLQAPARHSPRDEAAARMRCLARTRRHPIAVDLRLDAHIALPEPVAREAERAALLLARLTPYPYGTTALGDYHRRFYQRFGTGVQVPLLELIADSGIGWPDGYPGSSPRPVRPPYGRRDETLLALAQNAALDTRMEVVLDETLIAELDQTGSDPIRPPAHLELCTRVDAMSLDQLERGDFRLTVTSVSRAAGVVTGRFLSLLTGEERDALTAEFTQRPRDHEVLHAQLSFPPLDPATAHVTRTMQILPTVVSVAEHRDTASSHVLTAGDLAVSCDSHRLHITAPALGKRVEAWAMHALNLRKHTPPLARLIAELSRAQCAQVTDFDWGAASTLPFLPRVRSGRVVLAPARWRLAATDLPGRSADWAAWDAALARWQASRRLPQRVCLVDGDWRLPLDLDEAAHRVLLREQLNARPHAVLDEAPAPDAAGWCEGRAHEVIVPLTARRPQAEPRLPLPRHKRITNPREHGDSPAMSRLLYAKLYGDPLRQDIILAEHLPTLLAEWEETQPLWWFLRFREGGDHYLRLRIALPDSAPDTFGEAANRVSTWANELRRRGLLREVTYATSYPETGRWGSGNTLAAAEAVFMADSRAVLTQLAQPTPPHRHALAAANFAAIATAFTGDTATGMHWLIKHVPATPPAAVPRPIYAAAQRLADPREEFHALRGEPGGATIVDHWASRSRALAEYRSHLDGPHGVAPDDALDSLLHTHFLRACGIEPEDKAVCLYLARAAALAFATRTGDRS